MTSFYYFINFRKEDLHMKNYGNPKGGYCSMCKNNYMTFCNCCYEEGNDSLPDSFDPKGKLLVYRNLNIKRADYYDTVIHELLAWNGELKEDAEDIKQYRQY